MTEDSRESIMFAIHWCELDKDVGGKLAKGSFFKSLFVQQNAFDEPDEADMMGDVGNEGK